MNSAYARTPRYTEYSGKPSFSIIQVVTTMFLYCIFNKADSADQL